MSEKSGDDAVSSHVAQLLEAETDEIMLLRFQPFRDTLYSVDELIAGFTERNRQSYSHTTDFQIYLQYLASGSYAPTDYAVATMEAIHDNAIREATRSYLASISVKGAVGFMGGHDLPRGSPVYAEIALLSRDLARQGYLPVSGGGPGAMEATHLGAWHKNVSRATLVGSLRELRRQPDLPKNLGKIVSFDGKLDRRLVARAHAWLLPAYRISRRISNPGASLAIPTWLYGHEPTTLFATKIGKFFQNSVREDRLLAIATHGVIYFEGRAGTLQEVFQDAAQNYYRLPGEFSPMIFFGTRQWSETLPVIPVLKKLFTDDDFNRHVLVTDEPAKVVAFIGQRGNRETPLRRLLQSRRTEPFGKMLVPVRPTSHRSSDGRARG